MRISRGLAVLVLMAGVHQARAEGVVEFVNPMIGTGGHGHVFPGATAPFGMVQLSPDTRTETWDGCSGYHYSDGAILGFSHNHLSGTGAADLGNVMIMPTMGEVSLEEGKYKAAFSHADEKARPGYYQVVLPDRGVTVELTAMTRVGLSRYTFEKSGTGHVVLDLWHGIRNNPTEAKAQVTSDRTVSGYRRSKGWGGDKVFYYEMEFSQPFTGFGLEMDGRGTDAKEAQAGKVKGHFDFAVKTGDQVMVKVALSTDSAAGAQANIAAELPGWDFEATEEEARKAWEQALSAVRVETRDAKLREIFYTAAYHTMVAPTVLSDVGGRVRGPDGKVHTAKGYDYYTELSLWDTFRAENPLMTLTAPGRVNDVVRTMLDHAKWTPGGTLPIWSNAGKDTGTMIGNHAIPVIVNAYENGLRDWKEEEAMADMMASVEGDQNYQDEYRKLGYVTSGTGAALLANGKKPPRHEGTARTLEFAYDDACIARFARMLGKKDIAENYAARAGNWCEVFDAESGFMRGKMADGSWARGEKGWENRINFEDFVEANAWHYTFFVPQDVHGLIEAMGGDGKFVAKLDGCFESKAVIPNPLVDVTGLIGMYAHGNEPCHHVPYLYSYAGEPWRTAERTRQVAMSLYDNTVEGICGNDDCGQMSAWYVFNAMGFYPVDPASGEYVIGSPLVDKAVVKLDPHFYPGAAGGTFTVIAEHNVPGNRYVESAALNGKPLERSWLKFSEVTAGGELRLKIGSTPNKAWGAAIGERPGVERGE